mgnify:CR=1 FL=1
MQQKQKNNFAWLILIIAVISSFFIFQQLVKEEKANSVKPVKQSVKSKQQKLTQFPNESLLILAGAASKPPTEELAQAFQRKTGAQVNINFGGSGKMLADLKLAQKGDIFFPGSSDWMEVAKRDKVIDPKTEKRVVYLVNAINVQKGNPKGIKSLKDLLRPDVKVAIANPETVCVGSYAVELLEKNFTPQEQEKFRKNNLVTYLESCEKTANAISFKTVDAVIGWSVFASWDPQRIETIKLDATSLSRIGYIPIAITKYAKNKRLAKAFIDFVTSKEGLAVFKKHGYFITAKEAQNYIGTQKPLPVGGWFDVPKEWLQP